MNAELMRVGNFIAHYSSEYYDPAKAREYYLRTRELKGRSTSDLKSPEKKEAWNYTKTQIAEAKKNDTLSAAEEQKAFVEQARVMAQAKREQVSEQLQVYLEQITASGNSALEALSKDKEAQLADIYAKAKVQIDELRQKANQEIKALPPIPEGVSDARRAQLTARRKEAIAKIRGEFNTSVATISKNTADQREVIETKTAADREDLSARVTRLKDAGRDDANISREAVRTELKATVEKARVDYESKKQAIIDQYEATSQREFDGIRVNMPDAPASSKKPSTKSKKTK